MSTFALHTVLSFGQSVSSYATSTTQNELSCSSFDELISP